jgi:hypothetical protein
METTQDLPSGAPLSDADLERRIAPPALAMLAVAALSILLLAVSIIADPIRALCDACGLELEPPNRLVGIFDLFYRLFMLAVATLVLIGSLQLLRQRSWVLGLTAAVLLLVPCLGPCCPIGMPIGAWTLFVLLQPDVRQALQR